MKPYLSIIIPAYNEAKRISLTLIDIKRHCDKANYSTEIIVVDDGSKDETVDIVRRFKVLMDNIRIIELPRNQGKGVAVRVGMGAARGKYRLFMDADNSTAIDQFDKAIQFLNQGFPVVIASRYIKGAIMDPPQSLMRRIPSRIGNLIIQVLLLPGIKDTQCGFKVFEEEAAEKIFAMMVISRWGFDVEALALVKKYGYKIKEVPVLWVNKSMSHLGSPVFIKTLWEVVKIRWWLWNGMYDK